MVETLSALATTNNLEIIKNICPALVRHGRLTPILFDNFNGEMLNEISLKYFNKSLNLEPTLKPNIINSLVMDIVMEYKHEPNGFELFSKKINELIINTNNNVAN